MTFINIVVAVSSLRYNYKNRLTFKSIFIINKIFILYLGNEIGKGFFLEYFMVGYIICWVVLKDEKFFNIW